MKKLFCMITSLFLVVCIGCKTIDGTSSIVEQINDISQDQTTSETESEVSTPEPSEPTVIHTTPTPSTVVVEEDLTTNNYVVINPKPVVIKGDKPTSYSCITDEQKRIYAILKVALSNMVSEDIDLQINEAKDDATSIANDINIAFRAVSFDNPDFFWIPSGYALKQGGDRYFITFKHSNADNTVSYDYPITKSQRDTMVKVLDKKVNELIDAVKNLDSFEAEVYLHDYLCKNVAYTPDDSPLVYTSYGALVNGKAVCEGYSRAMQLLCDKLEIPCGLIYGWSEGIGHMWNIINLGDGWYHLDVTWDDDESNNLISHRYFNVTKYSITYDTDHIIAERYEQGNKYEDLDVYNFLNTDGISTAFNYFERKGHVISKLDDAEKNLIRQLAAENVDFFEIKNNSLESAESIVSFVAGVLERPVSYFASHDIVSIILRETEPAPQ